MSCNPLEIRSGSVVKSDSGSKRIVLQTDGKNVRYMTRGEMSFTERWTSLRDLAEWGDEIEPPHH
jgi:hypothetical protein